MSMNWIRHSVFLARTMSVGLATATMVFTPVAQGAAAQAQAENAAKLPASTAQSREIASVNPSVSPELLKAMSEMKVDKVGVQEFFKQTGLGGSKKVTVGEFYSKIRMKLTPSLRRDMDVWATTNHNSLMPQIQVSTYKGTEGKEQVRMVMTLADKKSVTISFDSENENKFLKVNNVNLSKKDVLYHEQSLRKLANGDKEIRSAIQKAGPTNRFRAPTKLSYEEYKRFTPGQRAAYLVELRYLVQAAQDAMAAYRGKTALNERERFQEYVIQQFLLQTAEAAKSKTPEFRDTCLINGYFTGYGKNSACAGGKEGRAMLGQVVAKKDRAACTSTQEPCNPLVYAYNKGGKPFCVNRNLDENRYATSQTCKDFSPLRVRTKEELASTDKEFLKKRLAEETEDKKRIVESYMKGQGQEINLVFNEEGKISKEQYALIEGYLNELNAYVDLAAAKCNRLPLSAIKEERGDQKSACEAIALRKINIETISIAPPPDVPVPVAPPPPPPAPVTELPRDCGLENPGSIVGEGNKCVCNGTITGPKGECKPAEPINPGDDNRCNDDKRDKSKDQQNGCPPVTAFNWKPLIYTGIGIAIVCAFLCKGKDKPKPTPVGPKPFDPCPPAPMPCAPDLPKPAGPVDPNTPAPILTPVPDTPVPTITPVKEPTPVESPTPVEILQPIPETTTNPSTSTTDPESVRQPTQRQGRQR